LHGAITAQRSQHCVAFLRCLSVQSCTVGRRQTQVTFFHSHVPASRIQFVLASLRARNEWKFFAVLPRADGALADGRPDSS